MSSAARMLLAALAACLVLTGCAGSGGGATNPAGVAINAQDPDTGFHGSVIDPPFELPDVSLTDTDGRAVSLDDVMGPVTVMFFGYTNCPDVCSTQMAEVASALRRMDDSVRDQVGVVFVTTDPDRDDTATLRTYLDRFDESFVGLTGEMSEIRVAAEGLRVALTGRTKVPGGYEVGHGTQLIGFGHDRTAGVIWTVGTPVGDLREDLTTLVAEA